MDNTRTSTNSPLSAPGCDAVLRAARGGAARAADALSRMVGAGVTTGVTEIALLPIDPLFPLAGEETVALTLHVFGGIGGTILITLPPDEAARLIGKLLDDLPATPPFSDLEHSALLEIGNVMASAYLNALGDELGLPLFPSVPTCVCGVPGESAGRLRGDSEGSSPAVGTSFSVEGSPRSGRILFFPAPDAPRGAAGLQPPR